MQPGREWQGRHAADAEDAARGPVARWKAGYPVRRGAQVRKCAGQTEKHSPEGNDMYSRKFGKSHGYAFMRMTLRSRLQWLEVA
jgi:hypothetical protein